MPFDPILITQSLIRCKSVTPEDDGAQEVLKAPLRELGFKIFDLPFDGDGSYPVRNFFARLGHEGPHLCYGGHTDVVPAGDESTWTHPPFEGVIDGGKMYGRGTSDMKAANAAFVCAADEYIKEYGLPKGSISLLITGDEEADAVNGTVKVLNWMRENDHLPDAALVGESSNINRLGEEIKIGRRGSFQGTLSVSGKQGHVAYPDLAANPLPNLIKLCDVLSAYKFDGGTAHFPPTNLELTSIDVGNSARNVIPAGGRALFNIRFNDLWDPGSLDQKLREILDEQNISYDLKTSCSAQSFVTAPGDWTKMVSACVSDHTDLTPKLSTSGGTSDARFFAVHNIPVVEFGLTNATIHQVDEFLAVDDLTALVHIYKDILVRFFAR